LAVLIIGSLYRVGSVGALPRTHTEIWETKWRHETVNKNDSTIISDSCFRHSINRVIMRARVIGESFAKDES